MKRLLPLFVCLLAACGQAQPTPSAPKSEYPGDYSIGYSCQTNGPVEVCRALQGGNLAVLDIRYKNGVLDARKVSAFVRVKYLYGNREGVFPTLYFQEPFAQVRVTGGCLVGMLGGCARSGTAEMRDILQWAQTSSGTLNALDLEVAFVDDHGIWDSRFGANYAFHFDQWPR